MSQHAKSVIAAMAVVIVSGVQAWQLATVGGFRAVDLLPVATVIVGAVLTRVVPNVPELPWAKTVVHGALAVLTALSTLVGSHPAGITAATLLTVAASTFLVWFVQEYLPAVPAAALAALSTAAAAAASGHADLGEITDALSQLQQLDPAPTAPIPAPSRPLPIEAEALAATTSTQAFPAVQAAG